MEKLKVADLLQLLGDDASVDQQLCNKVSRRITGGDRRLRLIASQPK